MQNFGGQTRFIMGEVQMANVVFVVPTLAMCSNFG